MVQLSMIKFKCYRNNGSEIRFERATIAEGSNHYFNLRKGSGSANWLSYFSDIDNDWILLF